MNTLLQLPSHITSVVVQEKYSDPYAWKRGPNESPANFGMRCNIKLHELGVEVIEESSGKHSTELVLTVCELPRKEGTFAQNPCHRVSVNMKKPPFLMMNEAALFTVRPAGPDTDSTTPTEDGSPHLIKYRCLNGLLPKTLEDGHPIPDGRPIQEECMKAHICVFNARCKVVEEGPWDKAGFAIWDVELQPDGDCG
jgi:hypothetical protein